VRVWEALAELTPQTVWELRRRTGLDPYVIKGVLAELEKEGIVISFRDEKLGWRYFLLKLPPSWEEDFQ
jgi:DNA-binding MarR family transcriptional regulator